MKYTRYSFYRKAVLYHLSLYSLLHLTEAAEELIEAGFQNDEDPLEVATQIVEDAESEDE